jgi:predicted DNA-binding transcriptional regulator YafY
VSDLSAADRRVKRCVWLYSRLSRNGSVDFRAYQRHFALTSRSYYRDLNLLQRCGVTLRPERDHGRMHFVSEAL